MVIKKDKSAKHDSPKTARTARMDKIEEFVGSIAAALHVDATGEGTTQDNIGQRKYGSILVPLIQTIADAMERFPGPFSGLSFTAPDLRAAEERIRELAFARDSVTALSERLGGQVRGCITQLTGQADTALMVIDMTLRHPVTDDATRARLREAAQPALDLLTSRKEAIAAAGQNTRSLRAEVKAALTSAEAHKKEAERLTKEKKALLGEEEHSSTLTASPPAVAARTGRKKTSRKLPR